MLNLRKIFNFENNFNSKQNSPLDNQIIAKDALTLDKLCPGENAIVCSVSEAEPRLCCKLQAMGIIEGQKVSVKQRAPFGDPISIGALGYTLSLRLCEAQAIRVVRA